MKKILSCASIAIFISVAYGQPTNEINSFRHFQYEYKGNSKVNAYLLMMLNHFNSPKLLLNKTSDSDPAVVNLHENEAAFATAYSNRVNHFFFDPNQAITPLLTSERIVSTSFTSITGTTDQKIVVNRPPVIRVINSNNGIGYDPEAVMISTDKYIIVVFRGTDRVANNIPVIQPLVYNLSEWIVTDFMALKVPARENIPGKVHKGFDNSLELIRKRLTDSLIRYNVANKKLWLTGHSLGSAHAQLFATYFKKATGITPTGVYGYAAPHVGDADFVSQMNTLLPGATLQRFDFMDDPIVHLPRFYMGYQRGGTRNYYSKESGSSNYFYNTGEVTFDLGKFFFCLHHTHWYARAAFFELIDHRPELQGQIPNAPDRPTEACTNVDYSYVTGGTSFFSPGGEDVATGTYLIKNASTGRYLEAPTLNADQNGTRVVTSNLGTVNNNKWSLKKIDNAILGGYTMQTTLSGKYVDADFLNTDNNGCKIQLWDRALVGFRTNQEWKISRLSNGNYQITNIKSPGKALSATAGCSTSDGCNTQLLDKSSTNMLQQWVFIKTN